MRIAKFIAEIYLVNKVSPNEKKTSINTNEKFTFLIFIFEAKYKYIARKYLKKMYLLHLPLPFIAKDNVMDYDETWKMKLVLWRRQQYE